MKKNSNLRALAAKTIYAVLEKGESLSIALPVSQYTLNPKDKALIQEICFGILRVLPVLEKIIQQVMSRPMMGKQRRLHYLIMVGLYQLAYTRVSPHAAISETVEAAAQLGCLSFKGLVNGVLRRFQREQEALMLSAKTENGQHLHPSWLLQKLQKAWPEKWEKIIDANNQRPPMWIRVNRRFHTREAWLALWREQGQNAMSSPEFSDALKLEKPVSVEQLAGFEKGWVTVQDVYAQASALFLDPQNGENILDLCAAPGGKTTHILEIAPCANVLAVDSDTQRLVKVTENLQRLRMKAEVCQGDGRFPDLWCQSRIFDRILLDAPCSSTGVIRRHPDIKWLRREEDIEKLVILQRDILDAIWPYLKPGGILLYATCSILPEENSLQIANFLSGHRDAQIIPLSGQCDKMGLQYFPDNEGGDGFFYAKLIKETYSHPENSE